MLPGIDAHPHARAVLEPALRPGGRPAHAYLLHGPPGSGKADVARAFAAALLADETRPSSAIAERIARSSHPDFTWVSPSGASEMLVSDIEEDVVAAAARTPFESSRRVFVIEHADAMNDQAANRMLKTLEEPPAFVHLLLLTDRREKVLPTIASRCQLVRFDPLASERIAESLAGVEPQRAQACARLSLGDARRAAMLASDEGEALRARAETFVRAALAGATAERPWIAMLDLARAAGASAGEGLQERLAGELELLPSKERRRHEREGADARRRAERRARTDALDEQLRLCELWLRDVLCIHQGAPELVHALDRGAQLKQDAHARESEPLRRGMELIADTRLHLALNVSEELALEALAYRLEDVLGAAVA